MGLSIHYSGRIADPELLPELIEEVSDIAGIHNWKHFVFDRRFPGNTYGKPDYNQSIYGICVTPPGCETIPICFLSNGRLSSLAHLKFFGKTQEQPESEYLYMLSVKTQFSDVATHQFIIHLFHYLSRKYFDNFRLTDEGEYWETNDVELLKTNFKRNAELIDGFSLAVECTPMEKGETIENYFDRLLNMIHKSRRL